MSEDYNIFYKETTQQKFIKFKEDNKNLPEFLSNFLSIKNLNDNGKYIPYQDIIDNFDNNNFVIFDKAPLFESDTQCKLSEFIKIQKIIEYLYERYAVPFCKKCNKECQKLSYEFLKNVFKDETSFLLIAFKIGVLKADKLENLGVNKIISNNIIHDIKDFKFLSSDFAIYKTLKFVDDEKKVNAFLESIHNISSYEVEIFIADDKKKVKNFINLKNYKKDLSFICPKCLKVVADSNIKNKNIDYKYNGISYDEFFKFSLLEVRDFFKNNNKKNDFSLNIIKRLDNLISFGLGKLKIDICIEKLSFVEYIKIFFAILKETLLSQKILVVKDIFDELNFTQQNDITSILQENFDNLIILLKKNIFKDSVFREYTDFFKLKSYIKEKNLKNLVDIDNLYKKITEIFLSSYDVKLSNFKLSDFSKCKYNDFINGKIKGEQFLNFRIFDLNFHQIMNTNIKSLYDLFIGFVKIEKCLKFLCDIDMGNNFLLDPISKISTINLEKIV